jgi:hypothetical protein
MPTTTIRQSFSPIETLGHRLNDLGIDPNSSVVSRIKLAQTLPTLGKRLVVGAFGLDSSGFRGTVTNAPERDQFVAGKYLTSITTGAGILAVSFSPHSADKPTMHLPVSRTHVLFNTPSEPGNEFLPKEFSELTVKADFTDGTFYLVSTDTTEAGGVETVLEQATSEYTARETRTAEALAALAGTLVYFEGASTLPPTIS